MKACKLNKQIFSLLMVLLCFTSCNGQTKTLKLPNKGKVANIGFGMQDKSGNIWLATNGDGIYLFDGKTFTNYREEDGLDNNIVYAILEDSKGNIWVGTKTGLNRCDFNKDLNYRKTFTPIPIQISEHHFFSSTNLPGVNPPTLNGVWSMMLDNDGTIWMGTDDGVYCYDGRKFTRFLDNKEVSNTDSLQLKAIFSILKDSKGHVWFTACAAEGISRFDGKKLTNVIPYENIGRTDRVIEDNKGIFWFAAVFKGVCRYDGIQFANNIFSDKINHGPCNILEDNEGNLWFDTQEGLGFYDGKIFKVLTEQDGLPNKSLSPLLKDNSGNLWFSAANMGLYCYDGKSFIPFSE